ncbi:GOLPH3/VPS74 family protein [Streptomyces sp. NPDC002537]
MTSDAAPALTLPEELLLLSFDPATGRKLCRQRFLEYGVAGAVLAELALAGHVVEERGRLTVIRPVPPADPLLAMAIASLPPAKGRGPRTSTWVRSAARHLDEPWLRRLVERGALRPERVKALGFLPLLRLPVGPVDLTSATRARFATAVRDGFPGPRERALAGLLSATGAAARLCPGLDGRRTRAAMRRLAREEWAAFAVRRNVSRDRAARSGSG